jgi:thiosulfate/3-mercaptopyruvate sulfurtransferase
MAGSIISVDGLAGVLHDHDTRIVDCRWYLGEPEAGREAYDDGHLPGAVYTSLDDDLSGTSGPGRHPLPSPAAFAASMATLGIDRSHRVVAYDDRGGAIAARLWWMGTAQGFPRIQVLDGGITAWRTAGRPLTRSEPPVSPVPPFEARPWSGVATIDDVADRPDETVVLDARSLERYRGDDEPVDPKAGHIPGARSLPFTDHLDERDQILDAAVVRRRMAEVGVDESTTVIAHCGSGVTACHLILAAEVAGLPRPSLYVGSWSDWSSTDLPIRTGPQP